MKDLNEYTAEVHRRVELECRTRKQLRAGVLAFCVPLVICVLAGALTLPRLLEKKGLGGTDGAELVRGAQNGGVGVLAGGVDEPDGKLPDQKGTPDDGTVIPPTGEPEGNSMDSVDDAVPADFSFRFVWGCYGISSYDSESGRLVKTGDATHPEDYVTELKLSEVQRAEFWELLSALELENYPAEYDPYNPPDAAQRVSSEPSRDLILTLRAEGRETTVSCRGICLGDVTGGYDERANAFLAVCDRLTDLLTQTPEWQALPDYEFLYE